MADSVGAYSRSILSSFLNIRATLCLISSCSSLRKRVSQDSWCKESSRDWIPPIAIKEEVYWVELLEKLCVPDRKGTNLAGPDLSFLFVGSIGMIPEKAEECCQLWILESQNIRNTEQGKWKEFECLRICSMSHTSPGVPLFAQEKNTSPFC